VGKEPHLGQLELRWPKGEEFLRKEGLIISLEKKGKRKGLILGKVYKIITFQKKEGKFPILIKGKK